MTDILVLILFVLSGAASGWLGVDLLPVDILKEVSMVGNDMMLDPGIGTCGKAGQGVPVGVAQPSILIDKMTVGGTKL